MIRINLLPYHEKAKKESQAKQIIIIAGSLIIFLLIVGAVHFWITVSVSSLEKEVKAKEERIVVLKKIIGEVEQIRNEKRVLERKLGVIQNLEKSRDYPVRLFADVASQVPTKDVWLEKLTQSGQSLAVEGRARDNFAVVRFIKNMEVSMYIQSVELVSSKQTEVSGMKLQQFVLSCVLKSGV
ncbi:MAG TPA: PilN domain-containing protein [Syntrophales bacterium]|jgi:type IV pilus assembly protein PilN|nr:PilN domain-containing protein [Syntrophales bacterium]HOU77807.1 PilN domain-containing protein [Syntrophales bacterium]HPC32994.1 PilN domain-containing protein [Syntrophales bacterium]HQG34386.1 PilN domain-containing protein [Syntrophales bacterium]HQI36793.1 PilN domain-containing protein [Syntrophales bacterium]